MTICAVQNLAKHVKGLFYYIHQKNVSLYCIVCFINPPLWRAYQNTCINFNNIGNVYIYIQKNRKKYLTTPHISNFISTFALFVNFYQTCSK